MDICHSLWEFLNYTNFYSVLILETISSGSETSGGNYLPFNWSQTRLTQYYVIKCLPKKKLLRFWNVFCQSKSFDEFNKITTLPPKSPTTTRTAEDDSFGTRKARSSFGRGFFKIKGGKRTASAPNLGETLLFWSSSSCSAVRVLTVTKNLPFPKTPRLCVQYQTNVGTQTYSCYFYFAVV